MKTIKEPQKSFVNYNRHFTCTMNSIVNEWAKPLIASTTCEVQHPRTDCQMHRGRAVRTWRCWVAVPRSMWAVVSWAEGKRDLEKPNKGKQRRGDDGMHGEGIGRWGKSCGKDRGAEMWEVGQRQKRRRRRKLLLARKQHHFPKFSNTKNLSVSN